MSKQVIIFSILTNVQKHKIKTCKGAVKCTVREQSASLDL
uniref:GH05702p n=1 Tax=Drosophila melanogaster TaxID=7227 RepID=Q8SZK0_DROME|nr:GH05702p [Drosophila melanogaster]